ncbi:LCB3 [[Candida] subhashii]|uniref:LCB3 n=1 Tax=[Candida] subhashii TaxID=561895 RepID=A0A8J5QHY7_9ASCO|nr:LCB3 [[Candida] subhashii]KAG7662413.1 LCB3 [[Candida] subhashii]
MEESAKSETLTNRTTKKSLPLKEVSPMVDHSGDAGNQSSDHYKARLSPFRYKLRSALIPLIRAENEYLHSMQTNLRHPWLDFYFAWTANLASHTFYVLMLPTPIWFGAGELSRDLVYVLGLGIYFTGFLKDFFCLPRPRSPPIHRITMSSYTTQEYGFPSSHSANATAVTLVLASRLFNLDISRTQFIILLSWLIIYYVSLIFGRLYCGMHGFLDLFVGSSVGAGVFLFRFFWGKQWDSLLFDNGFGIIPSAIFIVAMFLGLIHIHSEPVEDCPCFDDSVAFIGVLIGLDISHLIAYHTQYFMPTEAHTDPFLLPFDVNQGMMKNIGRFILGVTLVVIWKAISKPIIFTILPPIYKIIGVYLPRRNFISTAHAKSSVRHIRSASISNDHSSIGNFNNFIKGVTDHTKIDEIGPTTDIDYIEMLDYKKKTNRPASEVQNIEEKLLAKSGVFKPRYDVEIIGRIIVYAGVSTTAVWGLTCAISYVNV